MLFEANKGFRIGREQSVLILILMEYALWGQNFKIVMVFGKPS